jgi:hypothetical protein
MPSLVIQFLNFYPCGDGAGEIGTSDLILDLDCLGKTLRMSEVNWQDHQLC